jgi:hypothetical protein
MGGNADLFGSYLGGTVVYARIIPSMKLNTLCAKHAR